MGSGDRGVAMTWGDAILDALAGDPLSLRQLHKAVQERKGGWAMGADLALVKLRMDGEVVRFDREGTGMWTVPDRKPRMSK
jgi:hypothetical protein